MEEDVAKVVEEVYGTQERFLAEYARNPRAVFRSVNGQMRVVPLNLKTILQNFYTDLTVFRA